MVYYGKWSVFNDPKFDQRLIPEDEKEKEALRIGSLVSDWMTIEFDNKIVFAGKLNIEKLITYYYTEHTNHSAPLHICLPIQVADSPMSYFCHDYMEELILELDTRGTFQYIWRYQRDLFISNIVILPIISLTGLFGKAYFKSNYLFSICLFALFLSNHDH